MNKIKLLIGALLISATAWAQQTPNIVFILADDLGYGDLGVYGQKLIRTPNIDQLAKEGVKFTDFYAGAPVCSPSRSVLMTGQHTGHTTIRGNMTKQGGKPGNKGNKTIYRANLAVNDFTIGNLLRESGYTTAMAGKWHLDGYDSLATPIHRGFDYFSGWLISYPETYANGYWPTQRYVNGTTVSIDKNKNEAKGYYADAITTDEALDFLTKQKNTKKPFMLMVNYNNPHSPLDAPDNSAYADKEWPESMKTYASMVHNLDQNVGKIKKYLVDHDLKNTIVFFCSDNGARSEGTKKLTEVAEFFNSGGELKGYKRDMYDGGIRIPMIVWAPGLLPAGKVDHIPGYFADIMPTFAGIAKSKVKYQSDGTNILSFAGAKKEPAKPRFLYWEFFENGFEQAVRYGDWKAVKRAGKLELYNISKDIGEKNDVAAQNPAVVKTIETYLTTSRTESPFWPLN
ncbi:arylsulfatase [Dyadobacter sp. CY312]|uniref:arylsulfatase n=1 Tax=Dyadobacter sp. CY312 TaxID=2907303 RepID=UPI001F3A5BA6|nr:arylsulfatase [Dyadobacter sp. CY312]MCE7040154.1 arylsulfatase [Dyadobacter sp. CY312]